MLTARWKRSAGVALGGFGGRARGQFTGWLAYWAVCYELRNVPTRAAKSWFERAAV